mmetsp:Transcript_24270/g.40217  ORF Transcript_24270/g.40217 Transcript_24270/m.40217 type:complete len:202 (+) Transcript_24270:583-1188(+)
MSSTVTPVSLLNLSTVMNISALLPVRIIFLPCPCIQMSPLKLSVVIAWSLTLTMDQRWTFPMDCSFRASFTFLLQPISSFAQPLSLLQVCSRLIFRPRITKSNLSSTEKRNLNTLIVFQALHASERAAVLSEQSPLLSWVVNLISKRIVKSVRRGRSSKRFRTSTWEPQQNALTILSRMPTLSPPRTLNVSGITGTTPLKL